MFFQKLHQVAKKIQFFGIFTLIQIAANPIFLVGFLLFLILTAFLITTTGFTIFSSLLLFLVPDLNTKSVRIANEITSAVRYTLTIS